MLCTAIGTHLSLYPAMLLVPIYLLLPTFEVRSITMDGIAFILMFILISASWYHYDTRAQVE